MKSTLTLLTLHILLILLNLLGATLEKVHEINILDKDSVFNPEYQQRKLGGEVP